MNTAINRNVMYYTVSVKFLKVFGSRHGICFFLILCFVPTLTSIAQNTKGRQQEPVSNETPLADASAAQSNFLSRITTTPVTILKTFRDAGMSPTAHQMSKAELDVVAKAFSLLPPLHQRVLARHLHSISFLDNMPNTALTSPVGEEGGKKRYHITFRAGILHQSVSEWLTEKEQTCFATDSSGYSVSIQAGLLSAMTYVLLHEGTHVLDGSLGLISDPADRVKTDFSTSFTAGVWKDIRTPDWICSDCLADKNRFRPGGRPFAYADAPKVYNSLMETPFASFYSTASWHEDLAELVTLYHFTRVLKQPFKIIVSRPGAPTRVFEPMDNKRVRQRLGLLSTFYKQDFAGRRQ